jgi:homoserine kinase
LASRIRVRAYSSSANLGPGFDALAVAHTGFYDEVEARLEPGTGTVLVETVYGPYAADAGNAETAKRAAEALLELSGTRLEGEDLVLRVYKGVPPGLGLGSSGASAAAAAKAASQLLGLDADPATLIEAAGAGEAAAAGSPHYDNVAASLLGGLVVVAFDREGRLYARSLPLNAWFALYIPKPRIPTSAKTRMMREVLPRQVPLATAARNWARLAMLVAAAASGDIELLGKMMQDEIVEPVRQRFVACFNEARQTALNSGAAGVAISGAGPSLIALARDEKTARRVADAWLSECGCCEPDIVKVARVAPGASTV